MPRSSAAVGLPLILSVYLGSRRGAVNHSNRVNHALVNWAGQGRKSLETGDSLWGGSAVFRQKTVISQRLNITLGTLCVELQDKIHQPSGGNCIAQTLHKLLVVMQIVPCHKH